MSSFANKTIKGQNHLFMHFSVFLCISLQFPPFRYISLHFSASHSNSLHCKLYILYFNPIPTGVGIGLRHFEGVFRPHIILMANLQVGDKFYLMALMMCICGSLWIFYICRKVNIWIPVDFLNIFPCESSTSVER